MKGSPLNRVGDPPKDGIIKRALTGQRVSNSVETSSQRNAKGLYTKAELKAKNSNKDLYSEFSASLSKPGNKSNNPFVNGVDTSVVKPSTPKTPKPSTPPTPKTPPKKTNKKTPVSSEPIKTPSLTSKASETSNAKTTRETGVAVKGYEAKFLNSGKQTTKTEKSTKVTKSTEAPKSRKETRLAKTKNKAAKVKSDYNAGSRGQMEGKAARAKYDRLNKRAARIEKRITKKNKK